MYTSRKDRPGNLEISAMRDALKQTEHGQFEGWYAGDRLFNIEGLHQEIASVME
jgi:hypothetical protein